MSTHVEEGTAVPSPETLTFQDMILRLQRYWADLGCVIMQPYDNEVGAGTFHTATTLRSLGPATWKTAYVQPCRRPTDGRYGENPNRLQHYYQFQVLLKPSPDNVQDLYLNSLRAIGIDPARHDIRFVEDDWESPTLGAWGLGWEVWLNGMEVTQFTYFQQVGGFECDPVFCLQLRGGRHRASVRRVRSLRGRVRPRPRGRPAASGIRLRAEVLACLQPARCARRDQRHRAHGLHSARAHDRQGLLRRVSGARGGRRGPRTRR